MLIAIASDHAGFALKGELIPFLREAGHDVLDLGPDSDASVDYPAYGARLAAAIADGKATHGMPLCPG
jgi:ribose 5-phosphate isomerase B